MQDGGLKQAYVGEFRRGRRYGYGMLLVYVQFSFIYSILSHVLYIVMTDCRMLG